MLNIFVKIFNSILDSLCFFGRVSIFIGYGIVQVVSACLTWSVLFFQNAIYVLQVLLEDFSAFLDEALNVGDDFSFTVCKIVKDIENYFGGSFIGVFEWIRCTWLSVIAKQSTFFRSLIDIFCTSVRLVLDALTLIGTISKDSVRLLFNLLYNIITAPVTSFIYFCELLYCSIIVTIDTLITLPVESAIGLFVLISIVSLYWKYNGNKLVKFIIVFSYFCICRFFQILIAFCIILRMWMVRSYRRLYVPSFSSLYKSRNRRREESPSKIELMKKLEQEVSLRLCVVCMANPRNVILMNCQHFCMCHSCAKQIRNISNECPVCRKHIYRISDVYM